MARFKRQISLQVSLFLFHSSQAFLRSNIIQLKQTRLIKYLLLSDLKRPNNPLSIMTNIIALLLKIPFARHYLRTDVIVSSFQMTRNKWATSRENLSSGFTPRVDKPDCAATEARQRFAISDIETRGIILSIRRTTNALNRLRGCAGWSASLFFAYGIKQVFPWRSSNAYCSNNTVFSSRQKRNAGDIISNVNQYYAKYLNHVLFPDRNFLMRKISLLIM